MQWPNSRGTPACNQWRVLPDVVKRLSDNIQWTTDLGNAFLAQESDVMDAVQRMRQKAEGIGALKSTPEQVVETQVVENKKVIVIEQSNPETIYVPSYNPVVVYGQRRSTRIQRSATRRQDITRPARRSGSALASPRARSGAVGAGAGVQAGDTTTSPSTATMRSFGTTASTVAETSTRGSTTRCIAAASPIVARAQVDMRARGRA